MGQENRKEIVRSLRVYGTVPGPGLFSNAEALSRNGARSSRLELLAPLRPCVFAFKTNGNMDAAVTELR